MATPTSVRGMDAEALARLNSATKYPSIETYHVLGQRGRLTPEVGVRFDDVEEFEAYEKIDGTNTRLIFPPDGDHPLIGSRTELLTFLPDLVHNPSQGIVDTVRETARRLHETGQMADENVFTVVYGEVYGGKVGSNAKDYAADGVTTGFRVFDLAHVEADVLEYDREWIAGWRDGRQGPWWTPERGSRGGQEFWNSVDREDAAGMLGLETVPRLHVPGPPPTDPADTWQWLCEVSGVSTATLTEGARGNSEGVVVRTPGRSRVAKLRHEDYRRTLAGS